MLRIFAVLFINILMIAPTHAATFCVVSAGISPQCIYDDVTECQKKAAPNGACNLNPESFITYSGAMPYCTVRSNVFADCYYVDRSQCNTEASRARTICVENPVTKKKGMEAYDYDTRIQN